MRNEPAWLTAEQLIDINQRIVALANEPHLVLSVSLLESACARAANYWHYEEEDDVLILAVHLMLGIARNRCFEQGNKRTGFTAAVMFLELNGYELSGDADSEILGEFVTKVITREVKEEDLIASLRPFIKAL